jgi:hypothetical protein
MNSFFALTRGLSLILLLLGALALTASSADRLDLVQGLAGSAQGSFGPGAPSSSIDGSTTITCGASTLLFKGVTPSNGFMVQPFGTDIFVNDNGPAQPAPQQGFFVANAATTTGLSTFITPPGYKPMGQVYVFGTCASGTAYVAARAW